jgi:predicted alpha/beta-hydrolase family hydrolase
MLFVQGSRDAFGTPDELRLAVAGLDPAPTIHVVTGGDHSLKVPRAAGLPQPGVFADVQLAIVGWARETLRRTGAWS